MPPALLKNDAEDILYTGLSVCEWVREPVRPENFVNTQWRNFHPILVTDVFGFADVPINFWGQRSKVKVAAGSDPKNLWTP